MLHAETHAVPLHIYIVSSLMLYVAHHSFAVAHAPYVAVGVEPFGTGAFQLTHDVTSVST